jgi:hypothetical protein
MATGLKARLAEKKQQRLKALAEKNASEEEKQRENGKRNVFLLLMITL